MELFLIDKNTSFKYDRLLDDVYGSSFYFRYFKTNNLYDYFKNLIIALISNQPIVLIDSDISDKEIEGLNIEKINFPSQVKFPRILSFKDLTLKIESSRSTISIFTSGTTGQPKEVEHTIQSLTRTVRTGDLYKDHVWGFAYSPTHMAGLQVFFQAFLNKNLLVNVFNLSRSSIFYAIEKNSITHLSATPTFYRLLLPPDKKMDSVVRITFGGEKSTKKLYDSVSNLFPNSRINNIYASTEAGALFSSAGEFFRIPKDIANRIKVIDEEILIHKSLLGKSNSFTLKSDYYESGDLIEWINEPERIFRFKSRKNELINVGGYKVNPLEVENEILQIEGVNQVLVSSKPNSILGNILCADLIIDGSVELTELTIRDMLTKKLQDFKIPRRIKFVDTISTTRTGKIKRI